MPGLEKQRLLERVAQHGDALRFAAAELKADKEIVATAVAQNGYALRLSLAAAPVLPRRLAERLVRCSRRHWSAAPPYTSVC